VSDLGHVRCLAAGVVGTTDGLFDLDSKAPLDPNLGEVGYDILFPPAVTYLPRHVSTSAGLWVIDGNTNLLHCYDAPAVVTHAAFSFLGRSWIRECGHEFFA
jgi:hypothetical protein